MQGVRALIGQGDNGRQYPYLHRVADGEPFITLRLDTKEPIEIGDFVGIFTGLGNQYRKFAQAHDLDETEADIYVREVRSGSIVADLVPWVAAAWAALPDHLKRVEALIAFIENIKARLDKYLSGKGRDEDATKSDLDDFMRGVSAIARDPHGQATLEAAVFEDGQKKVRAALTFNTTQARRALDGLEAHRRELDREAAAEHQRVLLVFEQANTRRQQVGQKSGERVVIESISPRAFPLVYASEMAEERIKHEIREAEDNLFQKGFVVDVNVELRRGKPVAYRVTHVHDVIDLPD